MLGSMGVDSNGVRQNTKRTCLYCLRPVTKTVMTLVHLERTFAHFDIASCLQKN